MPTRVLVVEDEADIASVIKHALERRMQASVEIADRGDAAIEAAVADIPDLVLLDINLPVVNGFDVCRILRGRPATARVPIIMLTARATESDRVSGLEVGADDYVIKPFSTRELLARVDAVLRRCSGKPTPADHGVLRSGPLVADFNAVAVAVDGVCVRLTRTEFELLGALAASRGRVLSRDRLLECLRHAQEDISPRSIDVHVGRLRAKLGAAGRQIETVVGLGYRLVQPDLDTGAA